MESTSLRRDRAIWQYTDTLTINCGSLRISKLNTRKNYSFSQYRKAEATLAESVWLTSITGVHQDLEQDQTRITLNSKTS